MAWSGKGMAAETVNGRQAANAVYMTFTLTSIEHPVNPAARPWRPVIVFLERNAGYSSKT
jgi:hypothetical protein